MHVQFVLAFVHGFLQLQGQIAAILAILSGDADDVGESRDVEHFLDLGTHVLEHQCAASFIDTLLEHQEDAKALAGGVLQSAAVDFYVLKIAHHQRLKICLELRSSGRINASFEFNKGLSIILFCCYFHFILNFNVLFCYLYIRRRPFCTWSAHCSRFHKNS